jgi:predicted acyltransferase
VSIQAPAQVRRRIVSLDVLRGLAIIAMIFVNKEGPTTARYAPVQHAAWNGCTPTDWIYPFFIFIAGTALVVSLAQRRIDSAAFDRHVLYRTALLFGIGVGLQAVLSGNLHPQTIRIPGVLQRIALCYGATALLVRLFGWRGQAVVLLATLVGYWVALRTVPVPGFGAGVWTPEGHLSGYIDRVLLPGHLNRGSWDWTGIFSTIPAVGTMITGALAGHVLLSARPEAVKVRILILGGLAFALAGWLWGGGPAVVDGLSLGEAPGGGFRFPINKSMWTSSYVLYTSGLAALGLGVCYWLIEIKGRAAWALPLKATGANAMLAYVFSSLMIRGLELLHVDRWFFGLCASVASDPRNASLLFSASYSLLWVVIMMALYRKGIFWKL